MGAKQRVPGRMAISIPVFFFQKELEKASCLSGFSRPPIGVTALHEGRLELGMARRCLQAQILAVQLPCFLPSLLIIHKA